MTYIKTQEQHMTVYVCQYPGEDRHFLGFEERQAYQYCVMERIPVKTFRLYDYLEGKITIENPSLIVGNVPAIKKYLRENNFEIPEIPDYPTSLNNYYYRDIFELSLENINELRYPIFIKPKETKFFTGRVFENAGDIFMHCLTFEKMGNKHLLASTLIEFVSESRVYVMDSKVINVCQYSGIEDDTLPIDEVTHIVNKLNASGEAGDTYALDLGRDTNGNIAVVELNDAWAIGTYHGMDYRNYFHFLMHRWKQLTYAL